MNSSRGCSAGVPFQCCSCPPALAILRAQQRRRCRTSRQRLTIFGDGSLGGRLGGSLAGVCPLVSTLGDGSLGGRAVHVEARAAQHIVAAGRALPAAFRVRGRVRVRVRATDRVRARARVRARPRFRARGRVGARARGSSCTASRLCTCHRTHRNRPCDATRHCSCLGRACVGALTSRTPASRRAGSGSRRQTCTAPRFARRRTAAAALEEAAGCHSGRPSTRGSRRGHPARRDAGPRRERCTAHTVAA